MAPSRLPGGAFEFGAVKRPCLGALAPCYHDRMSTPVQERRLVWFSRLARWTAGVATAAGVGVLVGWLLDVELLRGVVHGLVAMNPLTALSVIAAGVALAWRPSAPVTRGKHLAASGCAIFVVAVGITTLGGFALGRNPGLDQLLFRAKLGENRVALNTGFSLLFLGAGLLTWDRESRLAHCAGHGFASVAAAVALLALLGYSYHAMPFYRASNTIPMALNTAIVLFVLPAGMFCAARGWAHALSCWRRRGQRHGAAIASGGDPHSGGDRLA